MLSDIQGNKRDKLNLSEKSKIDLARFVQIFHKFYKLDYYSDPLTNALLRKFNFDREYLRLADQSKYQADSQLEERTSVQSQMSSYSCIEGKEINSENIQPWSTMQIAFAYHSKDQDVILDQIDWNNSDWTLCKKLSIPIWVKNIDKLKQIIEWVAKNAYKSVSDVDGGANRAHKTALWYILINKKNILCNLYKAEQENKICDLLSNDFTQDRWMKAADRNAIAWISKK